MTDTRIRQGPEMSQIQIEMFYDGACPLCLKETRLLQRLDRRGRIQFTNIADPAFEPACYGRSIDQFMAEMHGRLPNGDWVTGVEVFRRLYSAVGFSFLVWFTWIPGISHLLNWFYAIFAKQRLKLAGRCTDVCELPAAQDPKTL